jgi:hydrogenase nickel incorporation protein HypB
LCDTCGCNVTRGNFEFARQPDSRGVSAVSVLRSLLHRNDAAATHNRAHFDAHRVLALNLMSSPGAGKTALLEASIDALRGEFSLAVIEGDLETDNDARRIRAKGVPAVQITTGSACHLDAHMVHDALHQLPLDAHDILFIENVGNLVCPASYDLGEQLRVVLMSVTEGEDKPRKYPGIFNSADLAVITKYDLAGPCDFDLAAASASIHAVRPGVAILTTSAKTGEGMDAWLDALAGLRAPRA